MLQRKRAIVMGGSMAGLLATRVLSDHFEEVVLLERDVFPSSAENRRGVPQGLHTHGLLASGGQVLDRLFQGIRDQLIGEGAIAGDIALKGRWFNEGACLAQFPSELAGLAMSRPFVENIVRKRVLSLDNVTPRENT